MDRKKNTPKIFENVFISDRAFVDLLDDNEITFGTFNQKYAWAT